MVDQKCEQKAEYTTYIQTGGKCSAYTAASIGRCRGEYLEKDDKSEK